MSRMILYNGQANNAWEEIQRTKGMARWKAVLLLTAGVMLFIAIAYIEEVQW